MKTKQSFWFLLLTFVLSLTARTMLAQSCPTDVPDNSSLNSTNLPCAWVASAQITAWIDTSKIPVGSNLYKGIQQSLAAWDTFLQQTGGGITVLTGPGIPQVLAQPSYAVSVGPTQAGKDATTTWAADSSGAVTNSTTLFSSSYQAQNNAGTLSQSQGAGLEGHEMAQPFGLGDCTATDCTTSISEDNGNTLPGPSACDQTRIAAIRTAIAAAYFNFSGGGGIGSGDGSACSSDPPNDTCTCTDANTYSCECPGTPTTCSGGDSAVCYEGSWTCTSVTTTTCTGSAPCTGAICVDGTWDSSSCSGCTDVCNSSCSNFDAAQCSCQSDSCSSSSCSGYDYCSCNPSDPSCGGDDGCINDYDPCDSAGCQYDQNYCDFLCEAFCECGHLRSASGELRLF